ncbi:hypothetical protein niasHT_012123 [Heterodera trifolii]|uniref:Uncharacterized protein n=1 Tax=Heterodera trifolii TaxID=157864 RepID=A0ABD2LAE6_9BILA
MSAIGENTQQPPVETTTEMPPTAVGEAQLGELKIVPELADSTPTKNNATNSSDSDDESNAEQLLVIALVNRFAQISERTIEPYKEIVEIQMLEPVHKMLDLIKSVIRAEMLYQRRVDQFKCRHDLKDRLQSSSELVKQIFMKILYNDSTLGGKEKVTMAKMLVDGGVNSLKLLLSFAARLSAAVGGNNGTNLRAFLAAYSCLKNVSADEIIFGYRIEPKVDPNGNTILVRIGWKEYTVDQQRISKTNFKFLQQLAKEELSQSPQDVVNVCQKIDTSVGIGAAMEGTESAATKLFSAVAAHFEASNNEIHQKTPSAGQVEHWEQSIMLCAMSTFGDNLLKRITENEQFQKYFDAIGANAGKGIFGTKIGIDKKVVLLHKSLNDFRNKYCSTVEENITKKDAFKFHEKFIHYGNAIFIEWNPWRELINSIDNVRSKLISDGVFKNTFNRNAKASNEFQQVINTLEHKFVEQIGQQNEEEGQEKQQRYGLVDKVIFWQNSVRVSEKAGTEVLYELEEMRAVFAQNADEFDQQQMIF